MLSSIDIKNIEKRARTERTSNDLGEVSPVGEKIFSLIETVYNSYVILYPLKTKKVAGFTRKQNGDIQVFVNTAFNLNFQVFAAAHELYHLIMFRQNIEENEIVVCNKKSDVNENLDDNIIDLEELKANYFAAAFLLPHDVVNNRFKSIKSDTDMIMEILKLQYEFEIPFKTVLRRLKELKILKTDREFRGLLSYEDKIFEFSKMFDDRMQEKLQTLETPSYRINDSLNSPKQAVDAYHNSLISYNKLEGILTGYQKNLNDFNISEQHDDIFDLSKLSDLAGDEYDEEN